MSETLQYMTKYLINEICIPGICAVCIEDYFNHFNTILKYTVLGIRVTQLNDTRTIAVKFFATCTKNTNHRHAIHVLYTCISIVFGFNTHDLHDTGAMLCQLSYTVYMYEPLLEAGQERVQFYTHYMKRMRYM